MVTINDKISLIIDADNLFGMNDPNVQSMITGDTYRIKELYKNSLEMIRNNVWWKFKHIVTEEVMTLGEWMEYYRCDINDPKSTVIFLRLAEPTLI